MAAVVEYDQLLMVMAGGRHSRQAVSPAVPIAPVLPTHRHHTSQTLTYFYTKITTLDNTVVLFQIILLPPVVCFTCIVFCVYYFIFSSFGYFHWYKVIWWLICYVSLVFLFGLYKISNICLPYKSPFKLVFVLFLSLLQCKHE